MDSTIPTIFSNTNTTVVEESNSNNESFARNNDDIPSPVSVRELVRRYDDLVGEQNLSWSPTPLLPQPHADRRLLQRLDQIRLVCSLLLRIDNNGAGDDDDHHHHKSETSWSMEQRARLLSTARRAHVLQQCLQQQQQQQRHQYLDGDDNDGRDAATLISVSIITQTAKRFHNNVNSSSCVIEWNRTGHQSNDSDDECDDSNNNNNGRRICIPTMNRDELAAEEEILWQMAHTPIPTSNTVTSAATERMPQQQQPQESLEQKLRREWSDLVYESAVQQQQEQQQLSMERV